MPNRMRTRITVKCKPAPRVTRLEKDSRGDLKNNRETRIGSIIINNCWLAFVARVYGNEICRIKIDRTYLIGTKLRKLEVGESFLNLLDYT